MFQLIKTISLIIYVGFSILTYILFLIRGRIISKEMQKEYSSYIDNYLNYKKCVDNPIILHFLILISCFVPILHLSLFQYSVMNKDKLKEKVHNELINPQNHKGD